jgi:predicted enzyme related to lactoylglutathione lyase
MSTIVHFEILADDVERSKKFYTDLFGWKIENGLDQLLMIRILDDNHNHDRRERK